MGMNLRNNALYVCLLKVKNDPDCGEVLQHLHAFFGMQRGNIKACQELLRKLIENWPESVNYPMQAGRLAYLKATKCCSGLTK